MVIEARKDFRLNCIEEAPVPQETESPETGAEDQPVLDENGDGELFKEHAEGEVLTPSKKKKKKEGKGVTWTKRLGRKVTSSLEQVFEGTVGELFDGMK